MTCVFILLINVERQKCSEGSRLIPASRRVFAFVALLPQNPTAAN